MTSLRRAGLGLGADAPHCGWLGLTQTALEVRIMPKPPGMVRTPMPLAATYLQERSMFDHVGFGVSDYAESKAFFLKALKPLGVTIAMEGPYGAGLGRGGKPSLWMCQAAEKPARLHLAFVAASRRQVDEFHRAALEAGGADNGAPGLRPHYHAHYYAAFVIGPDGHNVEAVCHEPGV